MFLETGIPEPSSCEATANCVIPYFSDISQSPPAKDEVVKNISMFLWNMLMASDVCGVTQIIKSATTHMLRIGTSQKVMIHNESS